MSRHLHPDDRPGLPSPGEDPCAWVILLLVALLTLYLVIVVPVTVYAETRWSPAVAERLDEAWPDLEAAAELAGVPTVALAAQAVTETGVRPIEGWYEPVLGVLQVSPCTWRWLLAGAGYDDHDLVDPVWTYHASAEVLLFLRIVYQRDGALLQCLWSDGNKALRYRQDCLYSRQVARLERLVRRHRDQVAQDEPLLALVQP